ncbi:carbohydrate-binding module family 18 protein [Xylariaceae sp. FL1651]|nr:carbohydrate-binding module family 18 protein [Xylariaceae sp. FL1651]
MFGLAANVVFTLTLLAASTAWSALTPDGTCGLVKGGANKGYTCPSDIKCCSSSGYCGSTDLHCLNSMGCQKAYSNSTAACVDPVPGSTISPDGTCGIVGVGKYGYKCPATGATCCSVA